jgi:hypothetical protein
MASNTVVTIAEQAIVKKPAVVKFAFEDFAYDDKKWRVTCAQVVTKTDRSCNVTIQETRGTTSAFVK